MAYLTLNEQLAAAQKFWPDTQWRLFNGEKVVGFNPNTGDGLRIESDARGQIYSVVVGTPFVEPIQVNKPVGAVKMGPWSRAAWASIGPFGTTARLGIEGAVNNRRANQEVQVWEDRPWTWKPDPYGGGVSFIKPPEPHNRGNRDKRGHHRPFNYKLPKFENPFDALGGVPDVGKAVEETFNKVLLTGGILVGVLGLTFIIANRK